MILIEGSIPVLRPSGASTFAQGWDAPAHRQAAPLLYVGAMLPDHECWSTAGILPLSHLSPSLQAALLKVAELGRLEPNWDGYGSPAIQRAALHSMVMVLQEIELYGLGPGHLAPVAGGGLHISWARGDKELELEVLPSGAIAYLTAQGDEGQEGSYNPGDPRTRDLAQWFLEP